jgi:hypothetical protein
MASFVSDEIACPPAAKQITMTGPPRWLLPGRDEWPPGFVTI